MFGLAPLERFATWHFIRRRAAGILRRIVLAFMDRILKFRGWMRPSLGVQLSLPWLPRGHTRTCMRSMLSSIGELHNQGVAILVPTLKRLKVSATRVHMVTLSKMAHNAPAYDRRLGGGKQWECLCAQFPDLPRYASPDGLLHFCAPQNCWNLPANLEPLRQSHHIQLRCLP